MGWSSGVDLFDNVVSVILRAPGNNDWKERAVRELIADFENHDADTLDETRFAAHPVVREAFINHRGITVAQRVENLKRLIPVEHHAEVESVADLVRDLE